MRCGLLSISNIPQLTLEEKNSLGDIWWGLDPDQDLLTQKPRLPPSVTTFHALNGPDPTKQG